MRLSTAAIVGTLLGVALFLPACGEDGTTAADTTSRTARAAPPATGRDSCRGQLHDFLGSMDVLRTRLARGLSYDQYLAEVKAVRHSYDRIDAHRLGLDCLLAAGGSGERAFNLYLDAANAWGDCLATVTCDTASVEPSLQRKWALASTRLSAAQRGAAPRRR
jgi:hypothetical protein